MRQHRTEAQLHEDRRRQLWIQVAVAVARCDLPTTSDTPYKYANAALDAFDARFKIPIDNSHEQKQT